MCSLCRVVCWQTNERLFPVRQLNAPQRLFHNITRNGKQLRTTADAPDTRVFSKLKNTYGLLVSSNTPNDVHVYGVKSDKGTCDSFQALPLTTNSTEFVVAVWK